MERIGFIGLGVMGSLMCKRLLMLGRPVFVTDVNQKAVQDLVGEEPQPVLPQKRWPKKATSFWLPCPMQKLSKMSCSENRDF